MVDKSRSGGIFKKTGRVIFNVGKVLALIEIIKGIRRLGQQTGGIDIGGGGGTN